MSDYPSTPTDYVAASYRYLRLAIVILVVTLGVSLVIEIFKASCWQGSISAYYYTPVHAVFVGALVAIGVSLVALKGRDSVEDLFFNLAGVLAPVVALVPTGRPSVLCSRSGDELTVPARALISNNIPSLLIGAAIAIFVAYVIAKVQGKVTLGKPPKTTSIGIVLSAVLLAVGVWWYRAYTTNFEDHAHFTAAVLMFVAIWCAVMVNAGWPDGVLRWLYTKLGEKPPEGEPTLRQLRYRRWYRGLSIYMVVAIAAIGVSFLTEWAQRVFWLEALEIAPFAVFWTAQTLEAWELGVTTQLADVDAV